jgi:alanine racemase
VREVARLAGGRPILAVVKTNAYGLGLREVGPILAARAEVAGLAVVKPDEALALRETGVTKPILLMGPFDETTGLELARREVRLAPFTDEAPALLTRIARRLGRAVPVHLYLDTGMSRMGMPFRRAAEWIVDLAARREVAIEGVFTELAETEDFDGLQLDRFLTLIRAARERGVRPGRLHAASTHGLFLRPDAVLDMVRPGLALYGAYPAEVRDRTVADLRPALRLMARVVRVERIEAGDGVSYGRGYVAQRPTWIATLPVGHADGYPRGAVRGCEVLIGGRLYRAIGAVSAGHTIVELGDEPTVAIGDEATLVGAEPPAIRPNAVAVRAGVSVYDVLMHLSEGLPKRLS